MRIFVTGAAGFIGQATIKELLLHGHSVIGLARNESNASIITAAGGTPLTGDLKDLDSLRRGAEASDGVIHLAFIHDFNDIASSCTADRAAIEAMGEVLAGTGKPFVLASGTLLLPKGVLGKEDTEPKADMPGFSDRAMSADLVYRLSKEKGVRGSVIRFAPTVYAEGKGGLIGRLIELYHEKGGPVVYIGDGSARWPACHRDDAAVLVRLALEKGKPGSTFHAVAEEGVSSKDSMGMVGRQMKLPVESRAVEEAAPALGMLAHVLALDNPTSSEETRKELGWQPTRAGLIADFEANFPF
ncbi:hypothetical protein MMC28_005679 [Mycoblastus sanguinarius]|nr:hypothetical protein [Mycoblastus sanguinarius]